MNVELQDLRRLAPLPNMLDRGKLAQKYSLAIRDKVKSWCAVIAPITNAASPETRQKLLGVEGVHDGEADLFGLLFENPNYRLLSSDKTAMRSLCRDPALVPIYERLCGRVICSESILLALLETVGIRALATSIAPLREHNGMLNAIFSMGENTSEAHCRDGLSSYLAEMSRDLGASFLFKF